MKKLYFTLLFLVFGFLVSAQTSTEVGITEGQLSVSLSGAANYSIPIAVPPGINGVVPQISLVYNSQGGNGLAGYGWNISGVSTISRIASTKFHDGAIDPVDLNALNRFALDGHRLLVKNGTSGVYGANGTEYETESFSNLKITSYGVHPDGAKFGPSYFIVEYPDGSKASYGSFADSRSITDWAIKYWENPQGVRINYTYFLNNNLLEIVSIKYGGTNITEPINEINFKYETRKRLEQSYVAGYSIIRSRILTEINVIGNGAGFRNYILNHEETSLQYQRLKNITEKSGDNTKSYNPKVFNYDTTISDFPFKINNPATLGISGIDYTNSDYISGDFDDDGKTDIILFSNITSKNKFTLFSNITSGKLNTGKSENVDTFETIFPATFLSSDTKVLPQGWALLKNTDKNCTISVYGTGSTSSTAKLYEKQFNFNKVVTKASNWSYCDPKDYTGVIVENVPIEYISGDFNGDGLTDVIAFEKSFYYEMRVCNFGNHTTEYQRPLYQGGTAYLLNLDRNSTNEPLNIGSIISNTNNKKFIVADFDGDGKSDIYVFEKNFLKIYTLGKDNKLVLLFQNTVADPGIVLDRQILFGDYNGDGKMDFVIPTEKDKDNWNFYLATGTVFNKINTVIGLTYTLGTSGYYQEMDSQGVIRYPYCVNDRSFIANDYNGDGKTDILLVQNLTVAQKGYKAVGEPVYSLLSLFENISVTNSAVNFKLLVSDIQVTGIKRNPIPVFTNHNEVNRNLEFSLINDNAILTFNSPKDNRTDVLLKGITNGNVVTETISYKTLKQDPYEPIYTPTSLTETFPNIDIVIAPGFKIVSMIEKQSSAVYKKQQFFYSGAVSNAEGLGFLGFRSVVRTNWFDDNNPLISSITKNDFALRGANTENYTVSGFATPFTTGTQLPPATFITKAILTYESELLPNKVYKIKNTTTKQYNSLDNTSSENRVVYDDNNNPLKSTTLVKESGATVQTTVSDIAYYPPTVSPYVVGRPSGKNQSVTISGDVMTSEEVYVYENNLLSNIKKKGTNTDYITEDNIYDVFGNITTKTITVSGLSPRITSYEYDPSGRFLTKSTDIERLSTSFDYNYSNGTLKSETNPYGLTTSYLYDSWFKKTTTTDYLGKKNSYVYARSGQKTIVTSTADDGSISEETFDDLGRKIKAGSKNIMGTFSYVDYIYDIYDRNYKVSEPYFGSAGSQWSETKYDDYGRVTQNIAFTGKTTDITYSGLTTTVNDGTKSKTSVKNAIGNVVSMTDTPGGTIKYTYFANGNLKESDYAGVKTTIEQDGWGRKTKLVDSSAGTYAYVYNGFGETTSTTTPNGTTNYILDAVGKVTQKTISGTNTNSKTTYYYDSSSKLLTSSKFEDLANGANIILNSFNYDASKRISKTVETTPYAVFTKEFTYDGYGRSDTESSTAATGGKSSSKVIKNTYKNGSHWQIVDNATSAILWQTNTVNTRGQLKNAQNGPTTITNEYDNYGLASQFKYDKTAGSANILTLNTVFDAKRGNLTSRTNSLFNRSESFIYDAQDRLTEFTNAKGVPEKQKYDDQGRITENSLGNYTYAKDKPYQNTSINLNADALNYYSDSTTNDNVEVFKDDMETQTGWGAVKYPNTNFCTYAIGGAHGGQVSLKLENKTATKYYVYSDKWININNAVDTQYTISAWVYSYYGQGEVILFIKNDCETAPIDNIIAESQNKWTKITKTILVPAYIKKINIRLDNNWGTVVFDDIQINKTESQVYKNSPEYEEEVKEVFNDGMETQTGWETVKYPNTNFCTYAIGGAHGGQVSLKLENKTATKYYVHSDKWININNAVDTQYTISTWVYTYYGQGEMVLFMKKECETGYYTQVDNVITESQNKWTKITKTILVPAYIKKLNIRLDNNWGTVVFDDVQITKIDSPPVVKNAQNITYNAFKSPVVIDGKEIDKISFEYNDSNSRTAMFYGGLQDEKLERPSRKYYSADGSMEIKENKTTGVFEFITYIGGDGYSAPIVLKSDGTTQEYLYLQRDNQGSIIAITNQTGTVVEKRLFDAWGAIVSVQDGAGNVLPGLTILDRGYTGHEHLQSIGLINMNGRIYDPKLHRFLQPDNFVQDPFSTQSFNRYGYCWNNPLLHTDPSGDIIPLIVVGIIVVSAAINVYQNWDNITGATGKFSDIKWGKLAGYTISGAASGALTVYGGPYGVVIGAGVQSILNSSVEGLDMEKTVMNTLGAVAGGFVTRGIGLKFDANFSNGIIGGNNAFNAIITGATREVVSSFSGSVTNDLISTKFANPGESFKKSLDPVNLGLNALGGGLTGLNGFTSQPSYIPQTQSPLLNSLELKPLTPFYLNPSLVIPQFIIPTRNVIPPSFQVPKFKPQFKG